jgi:IS30 family transposase
VWQILKVSAKIFSCFFPIQPYYHLFSVNRKEIILRSYVQLSQEERYFFSSHVAAGHSIPKIAKEMNRSPSTLYREFRRNLRPSGRYAAYVAHDYTTARRRRERRGSQFSHDNWAIIFGLIDIEWSPQQISNQLKDLGYFSISFQTIYRYIRKDRRKGGVIYKKLRILSKYGRKRYRSNDNRGVLKGKRMISERPESINRRLEFGHWEADTVMGKDRFQCILTLVERKTGLARIAKIPHRTAKLTIKAIAKIIKAEPELFKTITFDNGTEFHSYKVLERMFSITCYFANPHHPWERGCNENFNGLLRQYFPKGESLSYIGETKLFLICIRLNNRPRKRHGYKSPNEVFYGH